MSRGDCMSPEVRAFREAAKQALAAGTPASIRAFREAAKQALAAGTPASSLTQMVEGLDTPDSLGERLSGESEPPFALVRYSAMTYLDAVVFVGTHAECTEALGYQPMPNGPDQFEIVQVERSAP